MANLTTPPNDPLRTAAESDEPDRLYSTLQQNEHLFRTLCERSLAGIYVVRDGRFRYVNPALAEMLGYERHELAGLSPLRFVHPDDRAEVEAHIRRRLEGAAAAARYEARCIRKDGGVIHIEVLGARTAGQTPIELIGTVLDVTARKRAEALFHERLHFERLVADLSGAFVNVPSHELDGLIDGSLKTLVEFLGNDRSTLAVFTPDRRHIRVLHSYATPTCRPFPSGEVPDTQLPWYVGQLRRGEAVFLRCLPDDLPPGATAEREYCREQGLQSNIGIPMRAAGEVIGAITFAFVRHRCPWPEEVVARLQLIAGVFANAIRHQNDNRSLCAALAENEALRSRLEQENRYLREQMVLKHQHSAIVGRSDALHTVLCEAERVAATDAPVLLLGETGTGKELLAQTIHQLSPRKKRGMVIVNCASLPATLIESELFGREAGAYTGAASAQAGRFSVAHESTLFLDEIGEFPIELQAKLLRVLQDGRFERLGNPATVTVDVRIIAATNRDLGQAVREGKFRADLFHRLNVFPIRVPPLRERREDIPLLAWAFVESIGRRMGKAIKSIPRASMEKLQRYSWPGNVRELRNVIERAMILTSGDILHLDSPLLGPADTPRRQTLRDRERAQILETLEETGWRVRGAGGAADLLGLKPTTLEARMSRLGIRRDQRPRGAP